MTTNIIKQTIVGEPGVQSIKQVVRALEANSSITPTVWGSITGTLSDQADLAEALANAGGDNNYSTTEIDTHTSWINDKTIYKKTISVGTLPNNTTKSVRHNISQLDRVVKIEGYAHDPSFGGITTFFPSSYLDVNIADADIEIKSTTDLSTFTESYITLYYTKLLS